MRCLLYFTACAALLLGAAPVHASPAEPPTKLAVLYFENAGNPELAMLRLGLTQMLITDLSGSGKHDLLERGRLNEVLAELELQKSAAVDPATAVAMGKLVGAHYMVLGSYFELLGTLRVDARVVEVSTGRIVSVGESGSASTLLETEKRLALAIEAAVVEAERRRVEAGGAARPSPTRGTPADPGSTGAATGADRPSATADPAPTPPAPSRAADPLAAALAFSEGLDQLDRKDLSRAKASFRRAVELDPALDDARAELAALTI